MQNLSLIYEYACHEGNYRLLNTLKGARFEEKTADPKKPWSVVRDDDSVRNVGHLIARIVDHHAVRSGTYAGAG